MWEPGDLSAEDRAAMESCRKQRARVYARRLEVLEQGDATKINDVGVLFLLTDLHYRSWQVAAGEREEHWYWGDLVLVEPLPSSAGVG